MTDDRRRVGRYELFGAIAAGGMATVHLAKLKGPIGFSRTVAVKQLHRRFAGDPHVYEMLVDEARIAGRIQHPNVLSTLDVVSEGNELFLVMDYIAGESLSHLMRELARRQERMPLPVAATIAASMLYGLHAAHDTKNQRGEHLMIVHRDVSPQNVMVGVDGVTRVLDFGIAKATQRIQRSTLSGQVKGKMGYMAPEQIAGEELDRRTDLWAAAVVLWEMTTGKRLFGGGEPAQAMLRIVKGDYVAPSAVVSGVPPALDAIVMRGLARAPAERFQTARAMALAIEQAIVPATQREVGELVERLARTALEKRAGQISELEAGETMLSNASPVAPTTPPAPVPSPSEKRFVRWWVGAAVVGGAVAALVALGGERAPVPEEGPADVGQREKTPAGRDEAQVVASAPAVLEETETETGTEKTGTGTGTGTGAGADAGLAAKGPAAKAAGPPPGAVAAPPALAPTAELGEAAGPACNPPFYFERVGDNQIKKWKPECL